jgi:uncharacterized protein YigE (DUF2233 family)
MTLSAGYANVFQASRSTQSGYAVSTRRFRGVDYAVAAIDPTQVRIQAYVYDPADPQRRPFGNLDALAGWLRRRGDTLLLGMNGGIFARDFTNPQGLLVSESKVLREIDTLTRAPSPEVDGNFYRPQPNGVFFVMVDGQPRVTTTAVARPLVRQMVAATQSGPMLIINGQFTPAYASADTLPPWLGTPRQRHHEVDSASTTRNAVCIGSDGKVYWVKTEQKVRGDPFARFLRDEIHCRDALFLDGFYSALHAPRAGRHDPGHNLVTTLAVLPPRRSR